MEERRQHRSPFRTLGAVIVDVNSKHCGVMDSPELAHFFVTTANFADELTAALRLCRGEFESRNSAAGPSYQQFMDILTRWEAALRG